MRRKSYRSRSRRSYRPGRRSRRRVYRKRRGVPNYKTAPRQAVGFRL